MDVPTSPPQARTTIPLRWRDMDLLGHLNQSVYHELLEEGRAGLLEQLSGSSGHGTGDTWSLACVLARVELDYRREVRHSDGHVDVVVRVAGVGRTSFAMDHEVLRPDGELAAEGRSVLVAWDPAGRRSRALTAEERRALGVA